MARLIIADPNPNDRKLYSELIGPLGYNYILCSDGEEVLAEFNKEPADLIIIDYALPKLNAVQVCRKLRQDSDGVAVPIMIISSLDDEDRIIEGLDAGATDYILKPFGHAHFIGKLKSYINFYSLHQKDSLLIKNNSIFAGRYKIEKLIGCGSHSSIFLATDTQGGYGKVAIKLLLESASEENFASSFIKMANKIKKLDCENIVKIFDSGQYGGRLYLIMEYAEDGDLATILKRKTLSDYDTAELVSDISNGIKVLNENNIVHFDIKPENIMLNGHTFQLADFGIIPPQKRRTVSLRHTDIWTTLSYVAPEYLNPEFNNESNKHESCDIYSLGITAYEAFTGMNPFEASKVAVSISKQVNLIPPSLTEFGDVNPGFSQIIDSMLSKNPADRPSVTEVVSVFKDLLEELKDQPPVFGKQRQEIHNRNLANIPPDAELHAERHVGGGYIASPFPSMKKDFLEPESTGWLSLFGDGLLRQCRTILISAAVLAVIMLIGYSVVKMSMGRNYVETKGAMRVTLCKNCNFKEQKRIVDISQAKCSKCEQQKLAYVMFCNDCSSEFPFKKELLAKKNMSKEELFKHLERINRCPKCKSPNTQIAMTDGDLIKKLNEYKLKKVRK